MLSREPVSATLPQRLELDCRFPLLNSLLCRPEACVMTSRTNSNFLGVLGVFLACALSDPPPPKSPILCALGNSCRQAFTKYDY